MMGREKTGRPKGIDTWRDIQYLDLERRRLNIPDQAITWGMLSDAIKALLTNLPIGVYGGDGTTYDLGFNEQGTIVFVPVYFGGGRYGSCIYGMDRNYAIYVCVYGEATYTSLYGTAIYGTDGYGLSTDRYSVPPGAVYGGTIYG